MGITNPKYKAGQRVKITSGYPDHAYGGKNAVIVRVHEPSTSYDYTITILALEIDKETKFGVYENELAPFMNVDKIKKLKQAVMENEL